MDIVKPNGELTIRNAEELRRLQGALAAILDRDGDLMVDLGQVRECDAAGLQLICSARKSAAQRARGFQIAGISPEVEAAARELGVAFEQVPGQSGGAASGI